MCITCNTLWWIKMVQFWVLSIEDLVFITWPHKIKWVSIYLCRFSRSEFEYLQSSSVPSTLNFHCLHPPYYRTCKCWQWCLGIPFLCPWHSVYLMIKSIFWMDSNRCQQRVVFFFQQCFFPSIFSFYWRLFTNRLRVQMMTDDGDDRSWSVLVIKVNLRYVFKYHWLHFLLTRYSVVVVSFLPPLQRQHDDTGWQRWQTH